MDRIQSETVLLPHVIADAVAQGNREVADALAYKAERIYARNAHFRKRVRSTYGRDVLYAFMEHWLQAMKLRGQA